MIVIVFSMLSSYAFAHSFLSEQMKFARPRAALESKGDIIQEKLAGLGLKTNDLNIIIVAYKADRILEIYAKKASAARYEMLSSYAICNTSGVLGPKRA
ncbi:MAG: hypothetical protein LBB76_07770, partial [Azoarcus sp.]|nr:hypothetical protein [Azoarcus sp.]